MPIKSRALKTKPEVKVTFEVNKEDTKNATALALLSEHNEWEPITFKMLKSGKFKLDVNVPADIGSFQFIYKATGDEGDFMIIPDDGNTLITEWVGKMQY